MLTCSVWNEQGAVCALPGGGADQPAVTLHAQRRALRKKPLLARLDMLQHADQRSCHGAHLILIQKSWTKYLSICARKCSSCLKPASNSHFYFIHQSSSHSLGSCEGYRTISKSILQIIDANNPAEVIESFPVSDKHILCVASVPGAVQEDYREYEERMSGETETKRFSVCIRVSSSL